GGGSPRPGRGLDPLGGVASGVPERMVVVVGGGCGGDLAGVFTRWDLEASVIGELPDDGHLVVVDRLKEVARLPVRLLTDGAPVRMLEGRPPTQQSTGDHPDRLLVQPADMGAVLIRLMSSPNLGSRRT